MTERDSKHAEPGHKRATVPQTKAPLDFAVAGNRAMASLLTSPAAAIRAVNWREPTPPPAIQRHFLSEGASKSPRRGQVEDAALQRQIGTVQRMARASKSNTPTREELEAIPLTDDGQYVQDVFDFFYPSMPYTGGATPDAKRLADAMVRSANSKSRVMDLVPRPGRPTPAYLAKNMLQALYRWARAEGIYVAVRNEVARQHRTAFEELRNGIPITAL